MKHRFVHRNVVVAAAVGVLVAPAALAAQAHDHAHGADHGHAHHAAGPVDCTALATPPWTGLSEQDRQLILALESAVARYGTPEAARAAGFRPQFGNIPTMGVHWVHQGRMRAGMNVEEPDHLLYASIDGEDRLVGVAYAFTDRPATEVPVPFASELAHWHDHPELARPGETLHMLHVWFVPSSDGPFAGNNFWLPFWGAGIQPPNACWMADESISDRVQNVAMTLGLGQVGESGILARLRGPRASGDESAYAEHIAELNRAAAADDREAWAAAADRLLAARSPVDRLQATLLLQTLTHAQMSTAERDAQVR